MTSVHRMIGKHGIHPKKRLGQHFLHAAPTIKKIVNSLGIEKDDIVMEIGSGPGIMTGFVAQQARTVVAVEIDEDMIDVARKEHAEHKNIEWIKSDILDVDPSTFASGRKRIKIIGNLPYNVSSQIVFWMIDNRAFISKALIMVQKEVALRICAMPGGRDYGILSVICQTFAQCKRLFDVSAGNFIPPPDVMSSMVMMDFENPEYIVKNEKRFREIVKGAFGKRRKTIRNALIGSNTLQISLELLDETLSSLEISPSRRPETLKVQEFIDLAEMIELSRQRKNPLL